MNWFDQLTPQQQQEYKEDQERIAEARKHTLYYMVQNSVNLTDAEKQSLYNLVSSGCRKANKERLYRVIFYYGIHNCYGIYERVSFKNGVADYCAGQSYPDEIRTLRECLLSAF